MGSDPAMRQRQSLIAVSQSGNPQAQAQLGHICRVGDDLTARPRSGPATRLRQRSCFALPLSTDWPGQDGARSACRTESSTYAICPYLSPIVTIYLAKPLDGQLRACQYLLAFTPDANRTGVHQMHQHDSIQSVSSVISGQERKEPNQMPAKFESLNQSERWNRLVEAAKRAVREEGYEVVRLPGRGLSNMFKITKGGKTELAAIRTSQDRWFAFNPNEKDGWKTLDEVEHVVVAAVDVPGDAQKIIVHLLPAADVRKRFTAALKARQDAGYKKENFATWIALDTDSSGTPVSVGSGIAQKYEPIAVYSVQDHVSSEFRTATPGAELHSEPGPPSAHATPTSIADVLQRAREEVARLAGVPVVAVTLELKIGS